MPAITSPETSANPWLRMAALALVVAGLGLPVNELHLYALLVIAAVVVFCGAISCAASRWLAALSVVMLVIAGLWLWPAPRIDMGHNVFIVDAPGGALERGLPSDAFRQMRAEFDARYPVPRRCQPSVPGCWRGGGFPERTYAFSADGIHDRAPYSRRVTDVDFSDPVWLRLGFINERQYNWYGGASEIERGKRERRWWLLLHPWQLTMPYFVMLRFPADFVGGKLCWQGNVLWEGPDRRFTPWRHPEHACRPIEGGDVGRMIFGLSVATPLEMSLDPPLKLQFRRLVEPAFALLAVVAILLLLVRVERRALALPFTLIGLALVVVFLHDASFIGGIRPFDGGDDGLFYEGTGRQIVQHWLRGEYALALEGGEKVYYYGGPGLRYLRALERLLFGDSFYGYLSLILLLPLLLFALFRRFFTPRAALAFVLIFMAIPVGALFGTTLFHYVKWAARGFADPAAAILFLAGLIVLIGRTPEGPDHRFQPALGAGLLFALALWVRPNLAPGAAVLLGGAGLAALWRLEIRRLIGLCLGFLPVLGMAWHNWHFGGEFVLFSSNATLPAALPMPPQAYMAAFGELLAFDFDGPNLARWATQWLRWLSGPSESVLMAPLHAVAVLILLRVGCGRNYDPWLRLIAFAALALHAVAWFYLTFDRYHYLAWLLTLLVCAAFVAQEAMDWPWRAFPRGMQWLEHHPACAFLTRALDRCAAFTGIARA